INSEGDLRWIENVGLGDFNPILTANREKLVLIAGKHAVTEIRRYDVTNEKGFHLESIRSLNIHVFAGTIAPNNGVYLHRLGGAENLEPGTRSLFNRISSVMRADLQANLFWQSPQGIVHKTAVNLAQSQLGEPAIVFDSFGGWKWVGAGDLNGDGLTDFVGMNEARQLGAIFGNASMPPVLLREGKSIPPHWTVVAVADMNIDNRADIILRNTQNQLGVLYMNGVNQTDNGFLNHGKPVSPNLRLAAVADLNRDDYADLIWQTTDGRVAVSFMKGGFIDRSFYINDGRSVGIDWQLVAVRDMTGNGYNDFIWEHTDGRTAVWLMDKLRRTGAANLHKSIEMPLGWNLLGMQ
ncbi:MAG: hypothetical protein ACK4UN_17830, partial [Limisphaerales bacterium]